MGIPREIGVKGRRGKVNEVTGKKNKTKSEDTNKKGVSSHGEKKLKSCTRRE